MKVKMTKAMVKTLALACMTVAATAVADDKLEVTLNKISAEGVGEQIGTVTLEKAEGGVVFKPNLKGLEPGLHGFHLHQNPDCGPGQQDGETKAGMAAGGHWDPNKSGKHHGPFAKGHKGDLPALFVGDSGEATHPLFAPRIDLKEVQGKALMVHAGGDNYADEPEKLGGGGARVACGVINKR